MSKHASDCAVHNAPVLPPSPCDCGADQAQLPELAGATSLALQGDDFTPRKLAEMVAKFRTPPGLDWQPLADDIETIIDGKSAHEKIADTRKRTIEEAAAIVDAEYVRLGKYAESRERSNLMQCVTRLSAAIRSLSTGGE